MHGSFVIWYQKHLNREAGMFCLLVVCIKKKLTGHHELCSEIKLARLSVAVGRAIACVHAQQLVCMNQAYSKLRA